MCFWFHNIRNSQLTTDKPLLLPLDQFFDSMLCLQRSGVVSDLLFEDKFEFTFASQVSGSFAITMLANPAFDICGDAGVEIAVGKAKYIEMPDCFAHQ